MLNDGNNKFLSRLISIKKDITTLCYLLCILSVLRARLTKE